MANPNNFNSDQLRMYMYRGVPLSQDNHNLMKIDEETDDHQSKNLVLPKIFPEVFSMSFYNANKKKKT
jgi:hypothetical protein